MPDSRIIWSADPGNRNFRINHVTQRGVHVSPSFVKEILNSQPINSGIFQAFYTSCERERRFEIIRQQFYPRVPSRLGALFAFPEVDTARAATSETWNERRDLYRADILEGSTVLLADRTWLNCAIEDCDDAAHLYFKGVMSSHPKPELLIHGGIRAEMTPLNLDDLDTHRHRREHSLPAGRVPAALV